MKDTLCAINTMDSRLEVLRTRFGNIDIGLRIAIDEREPGTLDMDSNAMTFSKTMIASPKRNGVLFDFPRLYR